MSCGITPVCNPSPHWWNMCTAAGRKYRRVQVSVSCQGVHTLPLPLGGGGGCDWVAMNGVAVWYPVMIGQHCYTQGSDLITPKSNDIRGRYMWRCFLKWCIHIMPPFHYVVFVQPAVSQTQHWQTEPSGFLGDQKCPGSLNRMGRRCQVSK